MRIGEEKSPTMVAACEYALKGLKVIPVHSGLNGACTCGPACSKAGKHPRIKGWQDKATVDEKQITRWWKKWPEANVGIVTGKTSGIFVMDVDGARGMESLQRITQEHGWAPDTLIAETARGLHLYFSYPGQAVHNKVGLFEGIDIRGDNGLVVAPPSVHASGHVYQWESTARPISPAPDWLIAAVTTDDKLPEGSQTMTSREANEVHETYGEGERNDTLFRTACGLRNSGVTAAEIKTELMNINMYNCVPPLPEREVNEIAERASQFPAGVSKCHSKELKERENNLYYFKFIPRDWLSDEAVRVLDDFQTGWYINLIAQSWMAKGRLENDTRKLMKWANVRDPKQWEESSKDVLDWFEEVIDDGKSYLVHPKYAALWQEAFEKYMQTVYAGNKSGEKRREKARPISVEGEGSLQ